MKSLPLCIPRYRYWVYVWIDEILWNIPPSVHHSSLRNLIIIIEARFRNLCSFFLVFSIFQKPESDFVKARCVSVIEFWHLSFDKSSRPQKFRVCSFLKCWPTFQSFWVVAVIFLRIERITQRLHGARVSSDNKCFSANAIFKFFILISSFLNLILCQLLKESQVMPDSPTRICLCPSSFSMWWFANFSWSFF